MFRSLPTRAAVVSGKTIVIPSGDVILLHARYLREMSLYRTAARAKRPHAEELDLRDQSSDLAFVDRHGKGDTYWELPSLELQAFNDTTTEGPCDTAAPGRNAGPSLAAPQSPKEACAVWRIGTWCRDDHTPVTAAPEFEVLFGARLDTLLNPMLRTAFCTLSVCE
jgi:hypothetical protein